MAQVNEINGIVGEIAASAQEQATGLDQVNTAVNQMDQVTQQNAAMVEESTAAGHALAQETGELARLIGQFQLGDEVAAHRASPAATAARPAPKASTSSKAVAVLRTVGSGGAARKPVAETEASAWQEFRAYPETVFSRPRAGSASPSFGPRGTKHRETVMR